MPKYDKIWHFETYLSNTGVIPFLIDNQEFDLDWDAFEWVEYDKNIVMLLSKSLYKDKSNSIASIYEILNVSKTTLYRCLKKE